jgi:hypothetical protein
MASVNANSVTFSNISATTSGFVLSGGRYQIVANATFGGGNLQLQILSIDGSTWVNIGSTITAAGSVIQELGSGVFRIAVTTATAIFLSIIPVVEYNN